MAVQYSPMSGEWKAARSAQLNYTLMIFLSLRCRVYRRLCCNREWTHIVIVVIQKSK